MSAKKHKDKTTEYKVTSQTKQKILAAALQLFNQNGIAKTSLRDIGDKVGISPGNLQYHFKKREYLIEALYFELVQNIDNHLLQAETSSQNSNTLELLFAITQSTLHNLFRYRFFMLDFVQITRANEKIKKHYNQLSEKRKKQFAQIIATLIQQGVMRKEILPNEYENLYTRLQVYGDFWMSSVATTSVNMTPKNVEAYLQIINQAFFGYLTPKGQKVYFEIFRV